jgi:hypothetical protein
VFVGADAETNFLYHAGFEGDYDYDFEIVIVIVGGAETPYYCILYYNRDNALYFLNFVHSYANITTYREPNPLKQSFKESIRQFHYQHQPVDVISSALTIVRRQ